MVDQNPTETTTVAENKIDKKWFIVALVAAIGLFAGIIANINFSGDSSENFTGSLDVDNGDLKINWDRYVATDIELTESININESGIYHITGTLNNGMITVNAGDQSVVKLILDNVSITNSTGPAIACTSGDDLVIELVGNNNLKDSVTYSADLDEDINGAIYSKADLTFEGDGSLDIVANYQDAIVGKDNVKFNSGTYNIVAADDGIRGKDSVYIVNGAFTIESKGDGIKSANDADTGKGFVLIENGTIDISAGDDGIHAVRVLTIQDGTINIAKSYEGLESQKIIINGGNINIASSDDGINAGSSSDNTSKAARNAFDVDENCKIIINDGDIYINASGDGVDSNGWVYFNGGKVVVDGPTNNGNGALDSGAGIIMNGGEVIAVGSSGMAETLGNNSSVFSVSIYFGTTKSSGTKIEIKNSAGDVIVSHIAAKAFSHASIGTTSFQIGETYSIYLNGEKYQDITISNIVTTVGNSNSNTNLMPGGGRR